MYSIVPNAPLCPMCARVMKLSRTMPRVGGLPELQTFECRPCAVVFTEPVEEIVARPSRENAPPHLSV
jgi:hypothetical protein